MDRPGSSNCSTLRCGPRAGRARFRTTPGRRFQLGHRFERPGPPGLEATTPFRAEMVWSSARARVEHCAGGDERTGESRMPRRGTPFQRQNETGHGRLLIAVDDRVVAATRLDFVSLSGADFDFAERTVQGRIGRRVANVVLAAQFARDLVE